VSIPPPPDLRTFDLCFIDLEATGTIFGYHEIIDIAVIRTDPSGATIRGTWRQMLAPSHPDRLAPIAAEITGFSPSAWERHPKSSAMIWESFAEFCRQAVPVCHNPSFDRSFITLAAVAVNVSDLGLDYHWIGTESLSWPLYQSGVIPKMSLKHLSEHFGIEPEPLPHDALSGAHACRKVYLALVPPGNGHL
jgi:DNA polymerase III epsilon subunit-like protein